MAQDYLGVEKTYYEPTDHGYEAEIKKRLEEWKLDLELQLNATDENMPPLNKAGDAKSGVDDIKSELLRRVTNCLRQVH